MENKKCRVFYDINEMMCCGDPFSVSDLIIWTVIDAKNIRADYFDFSTVDYYCENHSSYQPLFSIQGKVESISIFYQKNQSMKNKLIAVNHAPRFVSKEDDMEAYGFIVELSNFVVKPC